jgi:hypothetical protein
MGLSRAVTSAIFFPSIAEMLTEIRRFKERTKEWMNEYIGTDKEKNVNHRGWFSIEAPNWLQP